MTDAARTTPRPANPAPASAHADLDAQVLHAEQRLIANEENLRRQLAGLGARVQEVARPVRLLRRAGPWLGLAGALCTLALLAWRRSPGAQPAMSVAGTPPRPRGLLSAIPWVSVVGIAWPLLPERWRARISPSTATTLLNLGLPALESLLALVHRAPASPRAPVPQLDLARYDGTWYEVARLPQRRERTCAGQPQVHCAVRRDGHVDVTRRCPTQAGRWRVVRGVARVQAGSGSCKLAFSLMPAWLRWRPQPGADYWVLHVDDRHTEALVSTPGRNGLWLLARQRQLPPERLQALLSVARERGYEVEGLHDHQPR